MTDLPNDVYCFHCGEKFTKQTTKDYENCPQCKKGFSDLTEEAQYAVQQVMKAWKEHTR